jgi:dGTPase
MEIAMLKQLTWEYVIDNPALATVQYGQKQIIRQLFEILDRLATDRKDWYSLPISMREQLELSARSSGVVEGHERSRIVADSIASMSETEATLRKLREPRAHSSAL